MVDVENIFLLLATKAHVSEGGIQGEHLISSTIDIPLVLRTSLTNTLHLGIIPYCIERYLGNH